MKSIHILIILTASIISLASANGVAEDQNRDRTGSPDGSSTCATCHAGGGFNPQMSIIVEDETGEEVLSYIPGETYTLKYSVSSIPFPTVYGFQTTVLFDDLSDAGTFTNPGANVQLEEVNTVQIPSRHIAEHANPGFIGNFQVQWIAPTEELPVTIYASSVTGNGNNESSGDGGTNTSLVLTPAQPDNIADLQLRSLSMMTDVQTWTLSNPENIPLDEILLIDTQGSVVAQQRNPQIDRDVLSRGLYFIAVRSNNSWRTFKVMH